MSVRCDADSLKLDGAEEVQRRVRKKSLYQWDLSDMKSHAGSGQPSTSLLVGPTPLRWVYSPYGLASMIRADRAGCIIRRITTVGLRRGVGRRFVQVWRLTRAGRNESALRTFRRQAPLVGYAEDK